MGVVTRIRTAFGAVAFATAVLSAATVAGAQDLKVGLASEPTSMDPHYHNQTANNSLASEVYDALTLQDALARGLDPDRPPGLTKIVRTV